MKRAVLFLLLSGFGHAAAAQALIQGHITDQEGRPVPWSNLRLLAMPDATQEAYAYADESGTYALPVRRPGLYRLRFDALAFQAQEVPLTVSESVRPAILRVDVALFPAPLELEEVIVRAEPALRLMKDTVELRTSAYATGSERVAEDLLKRLPGIEVGADGSIRVRGKAVSKVLIEGDDLFDRGYALLTKNLSAGVIAGVQILKGYTENPLLRGLQPSEAVALNIRLKEEVKGTLFGKGFVGGSPQTYETDLNLIQVRRNNKAFFLGNLNNSGKDATGDLQALLYPKLPAEASLSGDDPPLPSFMPQPRHQTGLPEMRSRSNNAELASLSGLFSPVEALKIKGHLFYSGDEQTQRSLSREVFNTDSLHFVNTESEWARRGVPVQSGRLSVLYTTQSQQLEWLTELQTSQLQARRQVLFNGHPVWEASREHATQAITRLSYSRRVDSATALQLSLQYSCNRKPRRMGLAGMDWGELIPPGSKGQPLFHKLSNQRESGGFDASLLRGRGRWQGNLMAAYAFRRATLESDFIQQEGPLAGPEFRNRGHNRFSRLQGGLQLAYTARTWNIRGRLLAQYLSNRFQDTGTEARQLLALVPALSLNGRPGKSHFLAASYTYGFRETSLQEQYSGYLPGGFRLLQRGLGRFETFRSHRWLFNYTFGEWGDPYLLTTTIMYNREPDYAGSDSQVGPNLVAASAFRLVGRDHLSWNGSYDQYLKGLKMNLKLRAELQAQQYESRYNGLSVQNNLLYGQAGPELRTVFDGGFNAHAGVQWTISRYRGNALSVSRSQTGFLDLEFRSGDWLLELGNEGYRYRDAGSGRSVWFSDLGVRYAPKGSGMALRVQLTNCWNTGMLNKLNLTETGRFENRYALRPRQLLVGLDFRF